MRRQIDDLLGLEFRSSIRRSARAKRRIEDGKRAYVGGKKKNEPERFAGGRSASRKAAEPEAETINAHRPPPRTRKEAVNSRTRVTPKPRSAPGRQLATAAATQVRRVAKPTVQAAPLPAAGGKLTGKAVVGNILRAFVVLLCIIVILFGVVAVQIVQYVVSETADDDVLLDLDHLRVPQNGYILAEDPETGEWIEYQKLQSASANSDWVSLDKIPQYMIDAVVSTEDKEFYAHGGFSLSRTVYAALNEVFGFQSTFGASTINQQLVKNLTGEKEVVDEEGSMLGGYKRKIKEIFRASFLDKTYGKDIVMEAYLNTMPLSGTIVGVQAAAKEYFNKDVGELTLTQCALVAGITQYPSKYNPFENPDMALERRNDVLTFMYEDGKLTKEQYDKALDKPLGLYEGPRESVELSGNTITSYFSDAVFLEVIDDLVEQGICDNRAAAVQYYYTGGLRIQSTVDLTLQNKMEEVYKLGYGEGGLFPAELTALTEVTREDGSVTREEVRPQSGMAVVRYDGTLAGVVGGIGEKQESLGLNRAVQSPRQVGSTMKPLTAYALGIDYGIINYSSIVPDTYVLAEQQWPVNYGPTQPTGNNVLVCDALAQSLNTVAAHIGEWVGVEDMYKYLGDTLEISTLVGEGTANDMGLSPMVLGGMTEGITAVELANAYAVFGGESTYGTFNSLHTYDRVLDANGNVVMEPEVITMQAVTAETGYIMNRLLKNVLHSSGPVYGTANGMALTTSDAVGKTGTTSDDKDRWFVGLSPDYVTAVWWGYDTNEAIRWSPEAATNIPPNVWRTIIDAVQEGTEDTEFPEKPGGVVEQYFCRDSGGLAGTGCYNTQLGYYTSGNIPDYCPIHGG